MKQWIRWSGLISFLVISTLLLLVWLFAAGPLIKYSIETFASQAAQAKVEVESVDLTFDPFGIEIQGVQVTNADKPMENLLQFERAVADIELLPLFLGKGIINEVALTGMAFATPRDTSGALVQDYDEKSAGDSEALNTADDAAKAAPISKQLPSADELLAREPLLTQQRGEAFKSSFATIKADTDNVIAALPDNKAFAAYEDELNRISSGRYESVEDFQQRKKEFDALKKRIKKDQRAIANAQKVLSEGKKDLQGQWSDLQAAPGQDLDNLKSKYQLDGAGIANLSRLLFGDKVGQWSEQGLYWYEKIRPFLVSEDESEEPETANNVRSEGRFVHFKSDRPLPDFLIRHMQLALTLPALKGKAMGDVAVQVYDITHQQAVINKPIRIIAKGQNLKQMQGLDFTGVLDYRKSPGVDKFELIVKGMVLNDYDVGAMGLKLKRSQLDIVANATRIAGDINATSKAQFSQASFSSKDKTQVAKEMAKALQKIDRFDINALAKGALTAPKVTISSDLDSQLNVAFNQRLKDKQKELEQQLLQKLNSKLLSYAGGYQQQLEAMDLTSGSLSAKQDKVKKLAKTELSSFEDQKKADADAAADKKRKQLEKEVKEKLKKLF